MNSMKAEALRWEWTIRSPTELTELKSLRLWFKPYRKINLQIDGVEKSIQTAWEAEINRHYNACGCGEGKFFVLIGFVAFCIVSWPITDFSVTWKDVGITFLCCMVGAATGKLFGKYRAWLKLRKKVSNMLKQLS